jgi:hypothetical protein
LAAAVGGGVRRDLAPIYRFVACRRGRHRDAHVMADDLVGSDLGDDYPEVAICEVCGRAVDWPNGTPHAAKPRGGVAVVLRLSLFFDRVAQHRLEHGELPS